MFLRLFLLLTLVPFLEIYLLIKLGQGLGWGNTFLLVIFTGVLGAWLLGRQGRSVLEELRQQTAQNQLPSEALATGFFTFVGGLLLLTPGVLTDLLGLSLVFPPTQKLWKWYFMGVWQKFVERGQVHIYQASWHRSEPTQRPRDPGVIDIKATSSETIPVNPSADKKSDN